MGITFKIRKKKRINEKNSEEMKWGIAD